MASTAQILAKEALLEPRIYLYREGIFWKAYQQSAYRVIRRKPGLKLKKKFIKAVSCEVVSLGFPGKTLERIFFKKEIEYLDEKLISISGDDTDMQGYQKWFEAVSLSGLPANAASGQQGPVLPDSSDTVLCKIREFPIEQSTPMDCMIFLVWARKALTGYGYI